MEWAWPSVAPCFSFWLARALEVPVCIPLCTGVATQGCAQLEHQLMQDAGHAYPRGGGQMLVFRSGAGNLDIHYWGGGAGGLMQLWLSNLQRAVDPPFHVSDEIG